MACSMEDRVRCRATADTPWNAHRVQGAEGVRLDSEEKTPARQLADDYFFGRTPVEDAEEFSDAGSSIHPHFASFDEATQRFMPGQPSQPNITPGPRQT